MLKVRNIIQIKNIINLSEDLVASYDNALDKVIYKEIIDNLDNINLTDNELISFKLYYLNDLSIKEISNKLDIKESNIKYYLYSARNKIKKRYDE